MQQDLKEQLNDHEIRLRSVEINMAALTRIEEKLDSIIAQGLSTEVEVQKHKVANLEDDIDDLKEMAQESQSNWDQYKKIFGIVATIITAAAIAGLFGIDITDII